MIGAGALRMMKRSSSVASIAYRLKGDYAKMAEERAVSQELVDRPDQSEPDETLPPM
jgi:hypothetical protein